MVVCDGDGDVGCRGGSEEREAEAARRYHETRVRSIVLGPLLDELEALTECGAVVKDLVASFLLPEVERRYLQLRGTAVDCFTLRWKAFRWSLRAQGACVRVLSL